MTMAKRSGRSSRRGVVLGRDKGKAGKRAHMVFFSNPTLLFLISNIGIFLYNFVLWPMWHPPVTSQPADASRDARMPREPVPSGRLQPQREQPEVFSASQMGLHLVDDLAEEQPSVRNSSTMDVPSAAAAAAARSRLSSASGHIPSHRRPPAASSSSSSFRVLTVPIYYLHVYKSGGTSFCATAQHSRKKVRLTD